MRKALGMLAVGALALVLVAVAGARGFAWKATLSPTAMVPAVKGSHGSGSFAASLKGYELQFKLSFSHLSGSATGANIGYGAAGKAGNLSIALCAPCKSPVTTSVGLDKSLQRALSQHLLYVVVETKQHPNGEIRGQVG